MAEQQTVLVSPDGETEWTPEDPSQAANLRAQGWAPKPAGKPATPKSDK